MCLDGIAEKQVQLLGQLLVRSTYPTRAMISIANEKRLTVLVSVTILQASFGAHIVTVHTDIKPLK